MYKQIQDIKKRKLDTCRQAVKSCQHNLHLANIKLEESKKALEDYKIWCKEEEKRRYAELIDQHVSSPELEQFNQSVALMYSKAAEYEQAIVNAEKEKSDTFKKLQAAEKELGHAQKQVEKFDLLEEEHQKILKEQAKVAEDQAMDEFLDSYRKRE